MKEQIIKSIISFIVTGGLGYCVSTIKNLKKKKKDRDDLILQKLDSLEKRLDVVEQDELDEIRIDLSNKFYVYDAMDKVDDYLVTSFREKCNKYFDKGGDTWIHPMYDKSFQWKVKVTGYLK